MFTALIVISSLSTAHLCTLSKVQAAMVTLITKCLDYCWQAKPLHLYFFSLFVLCFHLFKGAICTFL